MREIPAGLEKQHFPQPGAKNDAEHAVEKQIVDGFRLPAEFRTLPRAQTRQHDEAGEGHEIHQAVPAHGKRADGEGDGIELRMDQHGGRQAWK